MDKGEVESPNETIKDSSKKKKIFIGIGIIGVIALIFFIFLIVGYHYYEVKKSYTFQQSAYCYTINCPCDVTPNSSGSNTPVPPCNGYAIRKDNLGNTYCSNNPNIPVKS